MKRGSINWYRVTLIVGGVALLFGVTWLGKGLYQVLFGAPVDSKNERQIQTAMQRYVHKKGFNGRVQLKEAQQRGFSEGGVVATFTYQEQVAGKPVRIQFSSDINDQNRPLTEMAEPTDTLKTVALTRPAARQTTHRVGADFKKLASGALTYDQTEVSMETDAWNDRAAPQHWLKQRVAANRKSATAQARAYRGYYDLPLSELLRHGAAHFRITYQYHVTRDTDWNEHRGRRALKAALARCDFTTLPDGPYVVGFDMVSPATHDSSIEDYQLIVVKNGQPTYPRE